MEKKTRADAMEIKLFYKDKEKIIKKIANEIYLYTN